MYRLRPGIQRLKTKFWTDAYIYYEQTVNFHAIMENQRRVRKNV